MKLVARKTIPMANKQMSFNFWFVHTKEGTKVKEHLWVFAGRRFKLRNIPFRWKENRTELICSVEILTDEE